MCKGMKLPRCKGFDGVKCSFGTKTQLWYRRKDKGTGGLLELLLQLKAQKPGNLVPVHFLNQNTDIF